MSNWNIMKVSQIFLIMWLSAYNPIEEQQLSAVTVIENENSTEVTKMVFAHYFTPYPHLINNKLPGEDYYDKNYLNPFGEKSKFLNRGGLLRERPIYRAPFAEHLDWAMADASYEVRQAAAIGLDGFSMNILSTSGAHWERIIRIYDAAEELGEFRILIMPDMNAVFKRKPEEFVPMIQALAAREASYRLDDGRLVISPYLAENRSPTWWKEKLDELKTLGIQVALIPLYQGWTSDLAYFKEQEPAAYEEYVIGVSDWGNRTPQSGYRLAAVPAQVHDKGLLWMSPVAPQDYRPKSSNYTEAGNSEAFRAMWGSAISGGADWVQIITWNDYSEGSGIKPSSQTGYSFYDLAAYYIDWFKSGQQPIIEEDIMYAFYREHSTDAVLSGDVQTSVNRAVNGGAPRNEIELLAFLTSPATLKISIAGKNYQQEANAGITSFKVPLDEGKPDFKIVRNGIAVQQMSGRHTIDNKIDVQDMSYLGVSSKRSAFRENTLHLGWPIKLINGSANKIANADSMSPYARKSNALSTSLIFNGHGKVDGFTYQFLALPNSKQTILSFDINLKDACLKQSNLVMSIGDGKGKKGSALLLCNTSYPSTEMVNRTSTGDKVLADTKLLANSWYQMEITAKNNAANKQVYDVSMTRPDGTVVAHENMAFESTITDLGTIQFILEGSAKSTVEIMVDNISVGNKL